MNVDKTSLLSIISLRLAPPWYLLFGCYIAAGSTMSHVRIPQALFKRTHNTTWNYFLKGKHVGSAWSSP